MPGRDPYRQTAESPRPFPLGVGDELLLGDRRDLGAGCAVGGRQRYLGDSSTRNEGMRLWPLR